MAVRIRLARAGAKKAPFYRIVVADSRSPRDGRFIEILGRYNPRTNPSTVEVDVEKAEAWIAKGALPSETVEKLISIAKNPDAAAPVRESGLSKKAAAKAAEAAAAEAKAAEAKTAEPALAEEPAADEVVAEEPAADEVVAEEPAADEASE